MKRDNFILVTTSEVNSELRAYAQSLYGFYHNLKAIAERN